MTDQSSSPVRKALQGSPIKTMILAAFLSADLRVDPKPIEQFLDQMAARTEQMINANKETKDTDALKDFGNAGQMNPSSPNAVPGFDDGANARQTPPRTPAAAPTGKEKNTPVNEDKKNSNADQGNSPAPSGNEQGEHGQEKEGSGQESEQESGEEGKNDTEGEEKIEGETSQESKKEEPAAKTPKQRGSFTQSVNQLRYRKQLRQIDNQIQTAEREISSLQKNLDALNRQLKPIEERKAKLEKKIKTIKRMKLFLRILGWLLGPTIIGPVITAFIRKYMSTEEALMKSEAGRLENQIAEEKSKGIADIEKELQEKKQNIAALRTQAASLKNRTLLSRRKTA